MRPVEQAEVRLLRQVISLHQLAQDLRLELLLGKLDVPVVPIVRLLVHVCICDLCFESCRAWLLSLLRFGLLPVSLGLYCLLAHSLVLLSVVFK